MMYETHWTGLSRSSWKRDMDLQLFLHEVLRYWAGIHNRHCQIKCRDHRMRIGGAQWELSCSTGERFLVSG